MKKEEVINLIQEMQSSYERTGLITVDHMQPIFDECGIKRTLSRNDNPLHAGCMLLAAVTQAFLDGEIE